MALGIAQAGQAELAKKALGCERTIESLVCSGGGAGRLGEPSAMAAAAAVDPRHRTELLALTHPLQLARLEAVEAQRAAAEAAHGELAAGLAEAREAVQQAAQRGARQGAQLQELEEALEAQR